MDLFDLALYRALNKGGGGDITVEPLTVTANGQYAAPSGKAYSPVGVNVSGGGVEASIAVENGSLVTDGVTIATYPVITDDQIGASSSQGLSFGVDTSMIVPKVQIEFDLTLNSGNHIVLSFGGSNSSGGVYLISPTQFQLYASRIWFNVPISLTQNVKYRVKIELTHNKATLYVDGTQVAVGQSDHVKYSIAYIFVGDNVAILYNQSSHGEYSNDLVDNVAIRIGA